MPAMKGGQVRDFGQLPQFRPMQFAANAKTGLDCSDMPTKSYTIGRAGDIALYDDTVSRRHARLDVAGEKLTLTDLDSRNGTYEIHDKELVPFGGGEVELDQVFAFGDCVRSVRQLLKMVDAVPGQEKLSDTSAHSGSDADALDATQVGLAALPRQPLTRAKVLQLMDDIDARVVKDQSNLVQILADFGITKQRYQRWCREYGATAEQRQQSVEGLNRENERLRRVVSDLLLERELLKDALIDAGIEVPTVNPPTDTSKPPKPGLPGLTLVGAKK